MVGCTTPPTSCSFVFLPFSDPSSSIRLCCSLHACSTPSFSTFISGEHIHAYVCSSASQLLDAFLASGSGSAKSLPLRLLLCLLAESKRLMGTTVEGMLREGLPEALEELAGGEIRMGC